MIVEDEVHQIKIVQSQQTSRLEEIARNVEKLVTRHEFDPVKLIVYGLCACILTGFLAAVLSRVFVR